MKKMTIKIGIFALAIYFFALFADVKIFFIDSDIFWHLKMGKTMIEDHTIIKEALGSYSSNSLPYISHEFLFQCTIYIIHKLFGWAGLFVFFGLMFMVYALGIYKISEMMRLEKGKPKHHEILHLFMLIFLIYAYFNFVYFKVFSISLGFVVWNVVWLKKFMYKPTLKKAIVLGLFSLLISNFHGGTWIVPFVFFLFVMINGALSKSWNKYYLFALLFIIIGGLLNVGTYHSIFYAWEVGEYKDLLSSFQPPKFSKHKIDFLILVLFVIGSTTIYKNNWFEKLFALGIFYLGLSSGYQFIYLASLLPYFISSLIDDIPLVSKYKNIGITKKFIMLTMMIGVIIITFVQANQNNIVDKEMYPVQEMKFIEKDFDSKNQPKILADYMESGYLYYKDALILSDPRLDPYITKNTKGLHGWNAMERQMNAFGYGLITDEIGYQKPDYVIIKKKSKNNPKLKPKDVLINKEKKKLGKPVFTGKYGYVYKIN